MHYTHPVFQNKVKKAGFKQSMSRKGNCWDNAPMESFFGHMKDELEYEDCLTIQELRQRVNEYMLAYNTERYRWGLKKMIPDDQVAGAIFLKNSGTNLDFCIGVH
ncbi:IS3 family transposase [Paenibacillus whitsoniae]|uniref:Integrase catalytic domain-containing protein n=1 Tax=Paenibacillus whitsoniae TaxID=2496558 RepID=A0A430JDU7_9BACL|nr:IS3 family transposase [Paenibacillus whitsoniae]RTE09188.1 hypothetical protein EJQ19_12445 [Paenibacillus whitsoniae]